MIFLREYHLLKNVPELSVALLALIKGYGFPKYVIVKGSSGMGNRMRLLFHAVVYATITGRYLVVDWRDSFYSNDENINVFERFFQMKWPRYVSPWDQRLAEHCSTLPPTWNGLVQMNVTMAVRAFRKGKTGMTPAEAKELMGLRNPLDILNLSATEDYVLHWGCNDLINRLPPEILQKFFGSSDRRTIRRKIVRENLLPSLELEARINEFKKRAFEQDGKKIRVIGLHVRQSDLLPKRPYVEILDLLKDKMQRDPECRLFLATDNREIERHFREEFHERIVSTSKWIPADAGKPMHLAKECPDKILNGLEALTDMYLLAACDELYFQGNSSFSQMAQCLSQAPKECVRDWTLPAA
jgi:hypothetical protein